MEIQSTSNNVPKNSPAGEQTPTLSGENSNPIEEGYVMSSDMIRLCWEHSSYCGDLPTHFYLFFVKVDYRCIYCQNLKFIFSKNCFRPHNYAIIIVIMGFEIPVQL